MLTQTTYLVLAACGVAFVAPANAFSAPAAAAALSRPPAEFLRAVLAARTPDAEREGLLDELALLRRGRNPFRPSRWYSTRSRRVQRDRTGSALTPTRRRWSGISLTTRNA